MLSQDTRRVIPLWSNNQAMPGNCLILCTKIEGESLLFVRGVTFHFYTKKYYLYLTLNNKDMVDKIVFVKPGIYKVKDVPGRKNKKVEFEEPILGIVIESIVIGKKAHLVVKMEYGTGNIFSRVKQYGSSKSSVTFYIEQSEAYHDGSVNRIHRSIAKKEDPNLDKTFIIPIQDGYVSAAPISHDLDKMLATEGKVKIYKFKHFKHDITLEEKDLKPVIDSKIENIVLAKALAKSLGLTLGDTQEYENDDDTEIPFNLVNFNYYRNISGNLYIKPENVQSFKDDLVALHAKYNIDASSPNKLNVDDIDEMPQVKLSEDDIQLMILNKGLDTQSILHNGRGIIQGNKFGI